MEHGLLFWHWWAIGLLLMAVEAFMPGAFFLWIGIAALAVGVLAWVVPGASLFAQVGAFALLALGSVLVARRLRGRASEPPAEARINERARLYEGRTFTLDAPIVDGVGVLRVDDGQWRAVGPDLPAGQRVYVVSAQGATLRVAAVGADENGRRGHDAVSRT